MRLFVSSFFALAFMSCIFTTSCKSGSGRLSSADRNAIAGHVNEMMAIVAKDVTAKGPIAWLDHFDQSPDFFMASTGGLAFRDYPSAKKFITDTLVKTIHSINLRWSDINIYPISPDAASIGAVFHEDIGLPGGKVAIEDGYFTGTAHLSGQEWKLLNLHWSVKEK